MRRTSSTVIALLALCLTACALPKRFDVRHFSGNKDICFKSGAEVRLTNLVNTCPFFGGPPKEINSRWHVHLVTEWPAKLESLQEADVLQRNCQLPTVRDQVLQASNSRVTIGDVQTMWDYENGYRVQINGTAYLTNRQVEFVYERFGTKPFQPESTLESLFQECSN